MIGCHSLRLGTQRAKLFYKDIDGRWHAYRAVHCVKVHSSNSEERKHFTKAEAKLTRVSSSFKLTYLVCSFAGT